MTEISAIKVGTLTVGHPVVAGSTGLSQKANTGHIAFSDSIFVPKIIFLY